MNQSWVKLDQAFPLACLRLILLAINRFSLCIIPIPAEVVAQLEINRRSFCIPARRSSGDTSEPPAQKMKLKTRSSAFVASSQEDGNN